MKNESSMIQEFVQSIEPEMTNIMVKLKNFGFESTNVEITPNAYSIMASVDVWANGINYSCIVKTDGSMIVGRG